MTTCLLTPLAQHLSKNWQLLFCQPNLTKETSVAFSFVLFLLYISNCLHLMSIIQLYTLYLSPLPQRVPYDRQPCRCQVFSGWQRPAITSRLHLNSNMTKTHTKTFDVTTNQPQLHIIWIGTKYTWARFLFLTLNRYSKIGQDTRA